MHLNQNSMGNIRAFCEDEDKSGTLNTMLILLVLYIFFMYTAQKTLLPTVIHSIVMYLFVGWTLFQTLIVTRGNTLIGSYTKWYFLLIVYCVLSYAWATFVVGSSLYSMFVSLIITYCFICTIDSREKLNIIAKTFVISADVMCLMLLLTGQLTAGTEGDRLGQEITGNANSFSALLMMAAVFAAWLFVYNARGFWKRLLYLASISFLLYTMALSGGRKTIIAVMVCFFYFIIFKDIQKSVKTLGNILKAAVVLVIVYFAIMHIPVLYDTIGERFVQLFDMLLGGTSDVGSDDLRVVMVHMAFDKWLSSPFVGYGLDTFKYYNQSMTGHFYYAHNNYAELLYDLGIVGFVFYYGYVFYLTKKLVQCKTDNRSYKALGIGIVIELLLFDIGGVSYYTIITQVLLCMFFICFRITSEETEKYSALHEEEDNR